MTTTPTLRRLALAISLAAALPVTVQADEIRDDINREYDNHLEDLFLHFHTHPELSMQEHQTAARMASELREAGFTVTEGVGETGLVAILENGPGPMVAMRADMDGLPVEEKSGVSYPSTAKQLNPATGQEDFVMHACGHDMHMTSLVGTARQLAKRRDQWSGIAMLLVQPGEEVGLGAEAMRNDGLWERFGTPDFVLGLHVDSGVPAGKVDLLETVSPFAGIDSVDIIIHGVGSHGAFPHRSKDPVVLGSEIVLALQTIIARELPPYEAGVITVGSFHSGTKHNVISDEAKLQLTVRYTNEKTRQQLLSAIERIAVNMGRVAGLPEDMLPEVNVLDGASPPLINDQSLSSRLNGMWKERMGAEYLHLQAPDGMWGEDYVFFINEPLIPSAYWLIGGTPQDVIDAANAGGAPVPPHHSPLFRIAPEPAVKSGVESTVRAMMELMPAR